MVLWLFQVAAIASPPSPRLHVVFVDGGALEVESYTVEDDRAILILPGGGTLVVPASRIVRVEGHPARSRGEKGAAPASRTPATPAENQEESRATAEEQKAPPALSVDSIIKAAAARYGLEPQLLAAVIAVESGYRTDAISPKGAQGLMQLMPATARELSVKDPFDPEQNIDGGARYLKQLLDQHGDSFVEALAAYNAGAGRVARYNGLPPYKETIDYIRRVLEQYESRLRN
jgi:soluble lytic murein transglycosylase-like protein